MSKDMTPIKCNSFTEAVAKANSLNKDTVFTALSAAGITHVRVGFDGEGDQGQMDDAAAQANGNSVEFPSAIVTLYLPQFGSGDLMTAEISLPEAVEQLCYAYLEQEHGGWENNEGGFGEFTFDVAARKITLDFNARIIDTAYFGHTF